MLSKLFMHFELVIQYDHFKQLCTASAKIAVVQLLHHEEKRRAYHICVFNSMGSTSSYQMLIVETLMQALLIKKISDYFCN